MLAENRYFAADTHQREVAFQLYTAAAALPLICPHGHVSPRLFADPDCSFGTPVDLLLIPDHYVFRMLYSQGIRLEDLGIPRKDGRPVEQDHRKIWQTFADHFYLFRGTPTGLWLAHEFQNVFGVRDKLCGSNAQEVYDQIAARLKTIRPRQMFEQFNIEVLSTTDAATDTLADHQAIRASGWNGNIRPTLRPDAVINLDSDIWHEDIQRLSEASGISVHSYPAFIQALEQRRAFFKQMGATATDHAALTPYTTRLSEQEASAIFERALRGTVSAEDVCF